MNRESKDFLVLDHYATSFHSFMAYKRNADVSGAQSR